MLYRYDTQHIVLVHTYVSANRSRVLNRDANTQLCITVELCDTELTLQVLLDRCKTSHRSQVRP
jgi:hypothetical protein